MNKDVNIEEIDWIDKEVLEAEVLFKIGKEKFWAFCHPCNFKINTNYQVKFDFLENELVEDEFWNKNVEKQTKLVSSGKDRWSYNCYGVIRNVNPVLIDCGPITLSFGNWINDERIIGSYVYFEIDRLDILSN